MSVVFVDTGAWVALLNGKEKLHSLARESYEQLVDEGARLLTTSDVIDETATRLRSDAGLKAALAFETRSKPPKRERFCA